MKTWTEMTPRERDALPQSVDPSAWTPEERHAWHRHLNRHCMIERPQDFEPYGRRERNSSDCSCGCRFFIGLEGGLGADWGVCTNPESLRCSLLTFEHQGCPQFVYDPYGDDV